MAKLTDEQVRFLRDQGISLSQVMDGSGLSSRLRIARMDALGIPFYYGGAACKAGGHSLRTKPGHCIQCDTSKIAYQLRHSASGFVYIAYSPGTQFVKIGYCKAEPAERIALLRKESYGATSDWELKGFTYLEDQAGQREFSIHARLERHRKPVTYEKYPGVFVECREIFFCPLEIAMAAFNDVLRTN